ncbi:hypothetical protein II898_01570 [bacterium]|nr:hypothetical protein [bacterium]
MNYYLLSAYAVFSKLYDAKKSIYDLLSHYVVTFIRKNKKYNFVLSSFVYDFNDFYGFKLPQAVVKKVLSSSKGITFNRKTEEYSVDFKILPDSNIKDFDEYKKETDSILNSLVEYVQNIENSELSQEDKEQLCIDFSEYLLKTSCKNDKNLKLILAFLIENQDNEKCSKTLNTIKEGIIIYSGITTSLMLNDSINDVRGTWNTNLTIYLDTEILFHLYGYNGLFFKQQADDFLQLVKEINKKGHFIELKYFSEVDKEVKDYFYAAEKNVEKGKNVSTLTAMAYIVDGCKSQSDIILKKQQFFNFLEQQKINKDETDYYVEHNFQYNIEGGDCVIHPYLNYINILRKDNNSASLRNIKYILVTGKSEILKQSWNSTIYEDGDIPRAVSLDYLTEHFWFLLNKGFGKSKSLTSFDVFNRARIVFANLIANNVSDKYKEVHDQFNKKEITEEVLVETVADLRTHYRKPEDIKASDVEFLLNVLSEDSVNRIIHENEIRKINSEKNETKLIEAEKRIEELQKYKDIVMKLKKWLDFFKNILSAGKTIFFRSLPIILAFALAYFLVKMFPEYYDIITAALALISLFLALKNINDYRKDNKKRRLQ